MIDAVYEINPSTGQKVKEINWWEIKENLLVKQATPEQANNGFRANPGLVNKQAAYAAHRGTSFEPEKRGEQAIRGFADEVQAVYERLKPHARTDAEKALLIAEMERFQASYAQKYNDLLYAHSRIVSTMIAGPSGFPTERMRKINEAYDNKSRETYEWKDRAEKAMLRALKGLATEEAGGEVAVLKTKIAQAEKLQEMMVEANKIIRKKAELGIGGVSKHQQLINLGFTERQAAEALKPDYMGRIGFPSFALTNNSANIRRMKDRVIELEKKEVTPTAEIPFTGGYISDNREEDRVQIFFDQKPPQAMIDKLKSEGWRWAPSVGAWSRKRTDMALNSARRITGATAPAPQPPIIPTTEIKIPSELVTLLNRYKKHQDTVDEISKQTEAILQTSAMGQAPPVFHKLVEKQLDIIKKDISPIWDTLKNYIVPNSNFKTFWQETRWILGTLPPSYQEIQAILNKYNVKIPVIEQKVQVPVAPPVPALQPQAYTPRKFAELTYEMQREIKQLYEKGASESELARRYKLSIFGVKSAIHGKAVPQVAPHVPTPQPQVFFPAKEEPKTDDEVHSRIQKVIDIIKIYRDKGATYEDLVAGLKGYYLEQSGYVMDSNLNVQKLTDDLKKSGYNNLRELWRKIIVQAPVVPQVPAPQPYALPELRWVYGTKDGKWYLVGPEDRDYVHGITQARMKTIGPEAAKSEYLSPSLARAAAPVQPPVKYVPPKHPPLLYPAQPQRPAEEIMFVPNPEKMTRDEYVKEKYKRMAQVLRQQGKNAIAERVEKGARDPERTFKYETSHRDQVVLALAQNKAVSPEVLKDYPDIVGRIRKENEEILAKIKAERERIKVIERAEENELNAELNNLPPALKRHAETEIYSTLHLPETHKDYRNRYYIALGKVRRIAFAHLPGRIEPQPLVQPQEPWQMTQEEYWRAGAEGRAYEGRGTSDYNHKEAVYKAIIAGKPVPANVLKDYPDLMKKEVPEPTGYFTLRKVRELIRENNLKLSDEQLHKKNIQLRDYIRFIETPDEYSRKTLVKGGYYAGVIDQYVTGVVPVDPWLHQNLKSTLDEVDKELQRRKQGKEKIPVPTVPVAKSVYGKFVQTTFHVEERMRRYGHA